MATVKRTSLIREAGLDKKAASLILAGGITDPHEVATILNQSEEGKAALNGRKVLSADVTAFKESLERQTGASIAALVKSDDRSAELVALAHEKIEAIVGMSKDVEGTTRGLYARIQAWLADDTWQPTKDDAAVLNAAAKQMQLVLQIVDTIKSDRTVQTYIAKGTFVQNQGHSLDEVFELVKQTGLELGHTPAEVMSAFAKARAKAKEEQALYDL